MATSQSRSVAADTPAILVDPLGSTVGSGRGVLPYFNAIAAWSVSMTPTAATTLASAGAPRNGRDTATSARAPTSAAMTSDASTAVHVGSLPTWTDGIQGRGRVNRPFLRSSYTNRGTVTMLPAAKLMTPVP